jgi:hypothetical protein
MLTELNHADAQYYQYVIKSGILIVPTVLAWIAFFWKVRNYYQGRQAKVRAAAPSKAANPKNHAGCLPFSSD